MRFISMVDQQLQPGAHFSKKIINSAAKHQDEAAKHENIGSVKKRCKNKIVETDKTPFFGHGTKSLVIQPVFSAQKKT